jgi:hypothetical protein
MVNYHFFLAQHILIFIQSLEFISSFSVDSARDIKKYRLFSANVVTHYLAKKLRALCFKRDTAFGKWSFFYLRMNNKTILKFSIVLFLDLGLSKSNIFQKNR